MTGGAFQLARNPIFTAMTITAIVLVLIVPIGLAIAGVVVLVVALHPQVRAVEELYLAATHGESYRAYAAWVGRFLPWTVRLASPR